MFNKLKKWLAPELYKSIPVPPPAPSSEPDQPLTDKEKATMANEPYVSILKISLDSSDINNGSFELDWNEKFVINLIRQGYKIKQTDTDAQIVDRWFQTVCRNIALEVYEQEQADPEKRDIDMRVIQRKDLGGGYSEIA